MRPTSSPELYSAIEVNLGIEPSSEVYKTPASPGMLIDLRDEGGDRTHDGRFAISCLTAWRLHLTAFAILE